MHNRKWMIVVCLIVSYSIFSFSVPFLSRLLPSDVVRIYKTGSCVRYVPNFPLTLSLSFLSKYLPPISHFLKI